VDIENDEAISTAPYDLSRYLSPLQGFFLTYNEGQVLFDVENISVVRPASESNNLLRSAPEKEKENILRIKAENNLAASYSLIRYKAEVSNSFNRGKDVKKLFSPLDYVPEVYALVGEIPTDIRYINNNGDIIVPLGLKTEKTGEVKLTFNGMNDYLKASKIEFIDAQEQQTIDLTGMESYTYSYNHTVRGVMNGRFSLRFSNSMTALPDIDESGNLKVYNDSQGIYVISSATDPVQQVIVYDLHGRKIYESFLNTGYYPLQRNLYDSTWIVKVITKNEVKTVKLGIKN
jgi:hypothetical protein